MFENMGRKLLSVGFGINGFSLAGIAIAMVAIFGATLGATALEQWLYAGAHGALHVFGILLAFSIGIFVVERSKAFAAVCTVALILCGSYGIANMIGFASKNRLGVSTAAEVNTASADKRYRDDRALLESQIKWLRGQSLDTDLPRIQRTTFRKEVADLEAKLKALQPPKVEAATVLPDGQAAVLAELTGTGAKKWTLALSVPVAVLMFMAEVLSLILSVRLWPRRLPPAAGEVAARNDDDDDTGSETEQGGRSAPEQSVPRFTPRLITGGLLNRSRGPSIVERAVLADLRSRFENGQTVFSQQSLAREYKLPKVAVFRLMNRLEERKIVRRNKVGNRNEIVPGEAFLAAA